MFASMMVPTPCCPVCGGGGDLLYSGIRDHLFASPGEWCLRRCNGTDCGALWMDPAPSQELLPQLYDGYYTHSDRPIVHSFARKIYERARDAYLSRHYGYSLKLSLFDWAMGMLIGFIPSRRDYFDLAAFHTRFIPGGRLLEIGCGNGEHLLELANKGWQVTGLDVDPGAARQAAAKGLDVRSHSMQEARFSDNSFDVIAMVHVVEHVFSPKALLDECFRVLKPGGTLLIVTPNSSSWGARMFGQDWRGLEPPRHLQVLTPRAAAMLAQRVGFSLARLFTTQRDARNIFRKSVAIRNRRIGKHGDPGRFIDLLGRIVEECGRIAMSFSPLSGEELCLVARKPDTGASLQRLVAP